MSNSDLKQKFVKAVTATAQEWIDLQPAWLGNRAGVVLTEAQGVYYARISNGKVLNVHNTANVPPTFDLHVTIGRTKNLLKIWQILQVSEDYDVPAAAGQVAYHHKQHMWGAGDMLPVDPRQITFLTIVPSSGMIVKVYGGTVRIEDAFITVPSTLVDMSSYSPYVGAVFVNVEFDSSGTLSFNNGTTFGAPEMATASNIPIPATGKNLLGSVLLYEGQTSVSFTDILLAPSIGTPFAGSGHIIQDEGTPLTSRANLNFVGSRVEVTDDSGNDATIVTLDDGLTFNDLEGDPEDVTSGAPSVGTSAYAARRDHVHYGSSGGVGGGHIIQDEGTPLTARANLNFEGAGVAVTDDSGNDATVVTIAGGGTGETMVYDDVSEQADGSNVDFTLSSSPTGDVLLFFNTTLQSLDTFSVTGPTLTTTFVPDAGDKVIAVYGLTGVLVAVETTTSPTLRIYMQQNFK